MKDYLINAKILIVDDNFETLSLLGKLLSGYSSVIMPSNNGEQAIALAKSKSPDLILLDIGLPGKDGYEICAELKKDPLTKDIPIIFLTGKTGTDDIVKGLNEGAVDYIQKPFNKTELLARVSNHIGLVKIREKMLENQTMLYIKEMELVQKEKEKTETELEYKNKELISLAIQLTKFSNTSEKFIEAITHTVNIIDQENQEKLNNLIFSFRTQLKSDNWIEIEKLFLNLHLNFFSNLLSCYPNLTNNELRLCAFIRLNLSVKEITAITFQSEDTIKKSRYRLRQKIDIQTDENLHSQIMKF